ncbi:hypothetical protein BA062_26835 [Prauserella flavalba]|uniref:C4-dicarboxylate ABC transporter substrate-binding protein n=2 Tax=Prauserella flavalba TaxID=1477506 RepID=A0A318LGM8_9PSEU|nr:hypothetical protein BA062_26835 [Prauserella flavalba]
MTACGGGNAGNNNLWLMGTAPTGGTFYAVGAAMAEVSNKAVDDLRITAQVSAGSSEENIELLNRGEIELGFVDAGTLAEYAESGADTSKLRVLFNAYPSVMHWVVSGDSAVKSPADLKGQSVATGNPKSGMEANNRDLLQAGWDLTFDDIEPKPMHVEPGLQALVDGNVEAVNIPSAVPLSSVAQFANQHAVRLLDLSEADIAKIHEKRPFWTPYTIPGGTYKGTDKDSHTLALGSYLVTRNDVDEQKLRAFVNAVFAGRDTITHTVPIDRLLAPGDARTGFDFLRSIGVEPSPAADVIPQ